MVICSSPKVKQDNFEFRVALSLMILCPIDFLCLSARLRFPSLGNPSVVVIHPTYIPSLWTSMARMFFCGIVMTVHHRWSFHAVTASLPSLAEDSLLVNAHRSPGGRSRRRRGT